MGSARASRAGDDALVIADFGFSLLTRRWRGAGTRGARRSRKIRFLRIFVLFCLAIATAADLPRDSDYDYDPPAPGSYTLPVVKPAADGALLDSNNKPINLRDLTHGRITVLSFIYTRCAAPKACPYATGVLSQLHDLSAKDAALAKNMRLVSISFDPEYDTPQRLAAYSENVREEKSGCEWRFVTAKSRASRTYPRRLRSGRGQKA